MKDIFNVTDTSDLPSKLAADIEPKNRGRLRGSRYVGLFAMAQHPLSAQQVSAAMYRVHRKSIPVKRCRSALSLYVRQGRLVRVGKNRYALPENVSRFAAE